MGATTYVVNMACGPRCSDGAFIRKIGSGIYDNHILYTACMDFTDPYEATSLARALYNANPNHIVWIKPERA